MRSTAKWNNKEKQCYGYCGVDKNDASYCMCNPSLMHNEEFAILAGK